MSSSQSGQSPPSRTRSRCLPLAAWQFCSAFPRIALADASRRVVGSKLGDSHIGRDIPALIKHCRDGDHKLNELITHRFPFEDINEAMAVARSGAGLKTVLLFDGS